jgi:hypothetical protein
MDVQLKMAAVVPAREETPGIGIIRRSFMSRRSNLIGKTRIVQVDTTLFAKCDSNAG